MYIFAIQRQEDGADGKREPDIGNRMHHRDVVYEQQQQQHEKKDAGNIQWQRQRDIGDKLQQRDAVLQQRDGVYRQQQQQQQLETGSTEAGGHSWQREPVEQPPRDSGHRLRDVVRPHLGQGRGQGRQPVSNASARHTVRLSQHPDCIDDVHKYCRRSNLHNFAVVECLLDDLAVSNQHHRHHHQHHHSRAR